MQFLKKERASKLSVSTRRQQVKVGCTTCECNHQDGKEQNKQHPPKTGTNQQIADGKQQSLVNALEALRLDVASLKCSMKSGNEGNQNNARGGWKRRQKASKETCLCIVSRKREKRLLYLWVQ